VEPLVVFPAGTSKAPARKAPMSKSEVDDPNKVEGVKASSGATGQVS